MPDFARERALGGRVAGVDEAGRGPLAGPVIAAAVVLPAALDETPLLHGLDDSKKLTAAKRTALLAALEAEAEIGVGEASVDEIDRLNILQATFLAMRRALAALPAPPDHALIDGNRLPADLPCAATAIVKGDTLCLSIAAASVVAKVTRDRIMLRLAEAHPGYGWERNMGYGSKVHRAALQALGPTPHHRRSFAPDATYWRLG